MSFVASTFVVFLIVFLFSYYLSPVKWRWLSLLLASYFFYAWEEPVFLLLLMISTLVDYGCARIIANSPEKKAKRLLLFVSLAVNLGLLISYKYIDFIAQLCFSWADILDYRAYHSGSGFIIPVGISFYTFQTLSYTIDVYRGNAEVEKHLGRFAVFVSFFPQLVAGPIERSSKLLPQLSEKAAFKFKEIDWQAVYSLITWGVFKKIVVGDRIGVMVDKIFLHPESFSSPTLYLGGLLFIIQGYCDFSGYTSIARGLAKMVGIELSLNWNYPFFRTSFKAFWQNWHISLSQWFRDYIYKPLLGHDTGFVRWTMVILLVFLISGLWHGPNLTFVLWALLNAIALILEAALRKKGWLILPAGMKWMLVMFCQGLFCIAFRAESTASFLKMYDLMLVNPSLNLKADYVALDMWEFSLLITFCALVFMMVWEYFSFKSKHWIKRVESGVGFWVLVIVWILIGGEFNNEPFIYFQF